MAPARASSGGSTPVQNGPDYEKLIAAASNPFISPEARQTAATVLQSALSSNKVQTIDLGNAVGIMDQRGNLIRSIPKGEPNKGPEFGDIGTDPATGEKLMGWRDPRNQSVTPYRSQPQSNAPASAIPPVPPGVDPKVWREEQSKRAATEALPADTKTVSALRKEIQDVPSYKNIAQAAPVYKSMSRAAGRDTRAADVNLIYGLAKIMDPGSVVRESEMTVAQAVATLPQQLKATIESQLTSQGRLSPEVREAIMEEAHSRMLSYKDMFDIDANQFRGIAKRGRMNEEDVIPNFGEFEPWKRAAKSSTPTADGWIDIGNGATIREKR